MTMAITGDDEAVRMIGNHRYDDDDDDEYATILEKRKPILDAVKCTVFKLNSTNFLEYMTCNLFENYI